MMRSACPSSRSSWGSVNVMARLRAPTAVMIDRNDAATVYWRYSDQAIDSTVSSRNASSGRGSPVRRQRFLPRMTITSAMTKMTRMIAPQPYQVRA